MKKSLLIILCLFSLLLSCNAKKTAEAETSSPPNIILIMADDLGYETLECNGGTSYQTPNLNQLATEGMRFTHAYATPLCTPSRVQIMTGQYNFRNYERFGYLNPKEKTFANFLQDAGYATAVAGKWQLEGEENGPYPFGFDAYCLWQLTRGDFWYRYKDPVIYQNGEKLDSLEGKYGPDVFTDFILDYIEKQSQQPRPFLVYYPMCLVHDPFQPTPAMESFGTYEIEGLNDTTYFRNMMGYMDRQIGKIVAKLDSLRLRENTLVIFTGDNGTDRNVVSYMGNKAIRGDKGYTTDAGTHVPLIASWKGIIPEGEISDDLVDFTDFLPTLLEVARVDIPDTFVADGHSFLPQLQGKTGDPREWIFCDYDPQWSNFTARRYAQDKQYKLYENGEFYHFTTDWQEEQPLDTLNLDEAATASYEKLKGVLENFSGQ